jgi:hypothetical protein
MTDAQAKRLVEITDELIDETDQFGEIALLALRAHRNCRGSVLEMLVCVNHHQHSESGEVIKIKET